MEFSVAQEVRVFLFFVLCGGLLYFCYDLFSVIRKKTNSQGVMIHIQDCLYWVVCLGVLFFFVLYVNRGKVRFYELVGAALGAVLYWLVLSKWVVRFLCSFIENLSKIFKKILKILLTPLAFMYNIMYRCIYFVFLPVRRLGRRLGKRFSNACRQWRSFSQKK